MMAWILVVEDDKPIAKLIEINLKKRGYPVVEVASSLKEAKQKLEKAINPLHLAIVDMILRDSRGQLDPEAGIAFCELLRADQRTKHLPIITITAYADEGQEIRLRQLSNRYFNKPLDIKSFLDAVDELLRPNEGGNPE